MGRTATSASRLVRRFKLFERDNGIERRVGIRHAEDRRESASRRGGGPGSNRLLPFLTGFAQMHMDINQPRRNHQSGDVDDSIPRFGLEYPDRRNDAVLNANVGNAVQGTRSGRPRAPHEEANERLTGIDAQKKTASRSSWVRETAPPPSVLS